MKALTEKSTEHAWQKNTSSCQAAAKDPPAPMAVSKVNAAQAGTLQSYQASIL